MPTRAASPCRSTGCGGLSRNGTGWCEAHKQSQWERHQAGRSTTERGYGAAWRKARQVALRRDRSLCQPCERAGRITVATEVDHIRAKAHGGSDEASNLQAICRTCHREKSAHDRVGRV